MGFLGGIRNNKKKGKANAGDLAGLATMVSKNPQILTALAGLLSTRDASVGGSGGLAGLIGAFQSKGLGDMVSRWISTGPNPPVSAAQVTDALGQETIGQFALQAGVPASEAGSILAALLPAAIDHLTPDGKVPETNSLEGSLTTLLGLGR